ncbi:hypothetical protein IG631_04611 [Alternaria alternata]|nr:hypothetical protein IG631_04611 [Alternaria alternata]
MECKGIWRTTLGLCNKWRHIPSKDCQGVEGFMLGEAWTVLYGHHLTSMPSSISYNMASDKEYSDVNRTYHDAAEALSNCMSHVLQLHDMQTDLTPTSRPVACTQDRAIHIREWIFGAPTAAQRHAARYVSRRDIRLSGSDMGASLIPSRTTHRIRHTRTGHGLAAWTTCEHRR